MGQKIYWGVAVLALILCLIYIPTHVNFEWGAGAYIAIGWGIFLVIFGVIGHLAPSIQKYLDNKK